ncbi:MAG TPA: ABA4-like family protein, partial [Vicinamibacterales bacterium]|nr:ABA4-like family protein [Vicinamibacterales bacterium]
MTPEQIFSIVNLLALVAWVLLAVLPGRAWVSQAIAAGAIPVLAAVYVGLIGLNWRGSEGGFGSLAEVAQLFANPWLLLAGWTHYLAFDLFVGSWEVRDARVHGVPHWLVLPCLFLTFMFGPAGLLLYLLI